jgi:hypothetical protein
MHTRAQVFIYGLGRSEILNYILAGRFAGELHKALDNNRMDRSGTMMMVQTIGT